MSNTPQIALGIGLFLIGLYALLLWKPREVVEALVAYPRMRWPAWVLTGVGLVWFGWNLWQVDFGGLSYLKNLLFVAVPVAWVLIVTMIPDLLAVRALCGVLLLAGNPLLVQTRWHGSPAQFAVGILVYVVMLKCMVLVVYPHLWKRGLGWMSAESRRVRVWASGGMGVGLIVAVCGLLSL